MTINPNDLTIAREWAEDTLPVARSDRERATARVIQALPDEISANTPLGEVKGWANNMLFNDLSLDPSTLSAAGYVLWLPDEIVDGAKIRELIDQWREEAEDEMSIDPEDAEDYGVQRALRSCAHRLESVLPTPPRKPAVIKRGATAIHDEVGEVTIMSNRPNEQGRVAIVFDSKYTVDGCETLIVRPETLTAPKGEHTDD